MASISLSSITDPVVILTTGRAGSSLLAKIFEAHGVYADPGPTGENKLLKAAMIEKCGFDLLGPIPKADFDWKSTVKRIIGDKKLWLSKHGSFFHKIWHQFNPVWVKTQRPLQDILDSYTRCGYLHQYNERERRFIMSRQIEIMDSVPGITVNTPDLVQGRTDQIERALDGYGLGFDPVLTRKMIKREMFHVR